MTFSLQSVIDFIREKIQASDQVGILLSYMSEHPLLMMILILAAGVLTCFFGYKFIRLVTSLCGAGVGAFLGYLIVGLLNKLIPTLDARIAIGIIVVLGLVGMFSAFKLAKAGVFAACFYLTYKFVAPLCAGIISSFVAEKTGVSVSVLVVSVILGIIAGLLSIGLTKVMLTVCSAVGGGYIVAEYGALIAASLGIIQTTNTVILYVITGVLALLGLFTQFKVNAKKK